MKTMIIETIFDTSSKVLEVKADGKKIKNVVDVVFVGFSGGDEFFMDITTIDRSKTDEDGVTTRTHIMASSVEGSEGIEIVDMDLSQKQTREDLAKAFS